MKMIDLSTKKHVGPCADLFYTYIFSNTKEKEFIEALCRLLGCFETQRKGQPAHNAHAAIMDMKENLREYLFEDAEVLAQFDPAANSLEEVVLCYPAVYALALFRMSHILYNNDQRMPARLLTEYAHGKTAIDIHPGAVIGKRFFLDHGTGVVIGESTHIKDDVSLYQGVTLGAKRITKALQNRKRHPTVEENVIIYSNATVLGGDTVIGKGSTISGNVFLTESVPPNSFVYAQHNVTIKSKHERSSGT